MRYSCRYSHRGGYGCHLDHANQIRDDEPPTMSNKSVILRNVRIIMTYVAGAPAATAAAGTRTMAACLELESLISNSD